MIAYAWRSGLIGVGRVVPDGALQIARGPEAKLFDALSALARLSYDKPPNLLVPGVPEAADDDSRIGAMVKFSNRLRARMEGAARRTA